ncbi:MAG: ribosomal protein L7/L12 [Rhodoglobus sp.]|nr:ribosomal protein L7/L12 [Rhodoglobus sp.]
MKNIAGIFSLIINAAHGVTDDSLAWTALFTAARQEPTEAALRVAFRYLEVAAETTTSTSPEGRAALTALAELVSLALQAPGEVMEQRHIVNVLVGTHPRPAGPPLRMLLVSYPPSAMIAVIKRVREVTGLGLREAKALCDDAPSELKVFDDADEATYVTASFQALGCVVTLEGEPSSAPAQA